MKRKGGEKAQTKTEQVSHANYSPASILQLRSSQNDVIANKPLNQPRSGLHHVCLLDRYFS
jgi:hypothetical protein